MHIAIIGNGIAGATCALRLRELKPDWRISLISGESDYHYSRPALMYIFMGHMRYQDTKPYEDRVWDEKRIERVRGWVTEVDHANRRLRFHKAEPLAYDQLLLATGSKSNRFGWPGQDLDGVQGLYDLMDLHLLDENCRNAKNATIVGGGLIGIELAEMLHSRGLHVRFLVRESSYWNNVLPAEESAMINRLIGRTGFELHFKSELAEIVDNGHGRVGAVRTKDGQEFPCQLVGLTAGVSPNLDLVRETETIPTGRGILVDRQLRSRAEGIFAAGDCAEILQPSQPRNLLQQVWYTGKRQGGLAAANLAGGTEEYDSGIWYNSAKFLSLEYQTYGFLLAQLQEDQQTAWWQSEDGRRGTRVVWDSRGVVGFNFMGLRHRHRICEEWIAEARNPEDCVRRLSDSGFDPEFSHDFLPAMQGSLLEQIR